MKFQLFIALRYLFAKKSNNIINWITWISVIVVSIVSAALIIILSAMNGLSASVMDLYSDFDPDLKVTAVAGKRMHTPELRLDSLAHFPEIQTVVQSVEETVLLKYREHQEVATLKGVSDNFSRLAKIEDSMVDGYYATYGNGIEMCVLGSELALKLGINVNLYEPVNIYVPNLFGGAMPGDYFKTVSPKPVGVFDITTDFNAKYIIVRQRLASQLLGIENEISSLELQLKPEADVLEVQDKIKAFLGPDFQVKTRFEQNEFLFRSINAEKWISLLILSLVVILAVFNVVGSMTILIIDKEKDIFVLQSMGASLSTIKGIFWLEGSIISLVGSLLGLAIGMGGCYFQMATCYFGYGSGSRIDCFPVIFNWEDFFIVLGMVNGIALLTTLVPVRRIKGISHQ